MLKKRLLRLRYEQLAHLVRRDIKKRYKDTALGFLWIVLTPLIQSIVIAYVFVRIIGIRSTTLPDELYPFIVLTGLTAWNFVSHSISQAMNVFTSNRELVQNQPIPLLFLPLAATLVKLFDFLVEAAFLIVLLILFKHAPDWQVLVLVPFSAAIFFFVTGISLLFSLVYIYIRDVGHVVSFVLSIWFWLSPIFFPADIIPSHLPWFNLNPMVHILASFRNIMLYDTVDAEKLAKLLIMGFITFVIGLLVFNRYHKRTFDTV